ncbi:protein rep [Brasilonema sp. CT11]|nr:protein rep [Brasilonema sp. CT11]
MIIRAGCEKSAAYKSMLGQDSSDVEYLTDFSSKDKPWDSHRQLSERIADHYSQSPHEWQRKYAKRISECAPILEYGWVSDAETGEMQLRLYHAYLCRVRFCSCCQWRKSMKWKYRIYSVLPEIEKKYPGYRWVFLTLTVKDPSLKELKDCLGRMRAGWKNLQRYKDYPAVGAIRGLEITKDKDSNPHPHFHALLLVSPGYFSGKKYLNQKQWIALWRKALKIDYDPNVDVRSVKPKKGTEGENAAIRSAVAEALKYSVKSDELANDPDWLYQMTDILHGVRMVEVFGELRPFFRELEKEEDDLVHLEDDPEQSGNQGGEFFNWMTSKKRYGRKKKSIDAELAN